MGEAHDHDPAGRQSGVASQVSLAILHAAVVLPAVEFEVDPARLVEDVEVHRPSPERKRHLPAQAQTAEDIRVPPQLQLAAAPELEQVEQVHEVAAAAESGSRAECVAHPADRGHTPADREDHRSTLGVTAEQRPTVDDAPLQSDHGKLSTDQHLGRRETQRGPAMDDEARRSA